MAKNKYYAVRKGIIPGIYTSWGECQQNINGFSGAEYKSFSTKEEAEAFCDSNSKDNSDTTKRIYSEAEAVAYISGCFNEEANEYAYGVVVFYNGGEEHLSGKFIESDILDMKNVAGEIEGAKRAMKFCLDSKIKSIDIFYNYEGIEKWCTGAWRAKKTQTKEYKNYYNSLKNVLKVSFYKLQINSGDTYNNLAESLAKAAVGLGDNLTSISVHTGGIVVNGIKKSDLESVLELMQEDFEDIKISSRDIPYALQYELEIKKPTKQKITITLYDSKNKIWISGRQEDLFNRLSLYIAELLEIDEIPKFLNTVHNMDIDKDVVENEFMRLFPNSHDKLPKDLKKYLHQAVYNLHITGNVYVANYLVEPALRPLEGILKLALKNNGIPIRREGEEKDSFFAFKEINGKFVLKDQFRKEEHSKELINYLSKCYGYFHDNRHTLFHWDDPTEEMDTTRILYTVPEAIAIIRDAIALIDEFYTIS